MCRGQGGQQASGRDSPLSGRVGPPVKGTGLSGASPSSTTSRVPFPVLTPRPSTSTLHTLTPASRPRVSRMCSSAWWSQRKREEGRGARRPWNSAVSFLTSIPGATLSRYHVTEPMAILPWLALKEQGRMAGDPSWVRISGGWDTQRTQDPGGREKTRRSAFPVTPERKELRTCGRMSLLYPYPQRAPRDKHFRCLIKPFIPI